MELHDSIRKDYLRLQKTLERGRLESTRRKAQLTSDAEAEKLQVEQREPDHLQVLQANCQNELWVKLGRNEESDEYIKIGPLQRLFMHLFNWRSHRLFSNEQRREARRIKQEAKRSRRPLSPAGSPRSYLAPSRSHYAVSARTLATRSRPGIRSAL
ncbi:MAG: hypothetical protein F4Y26_04930 [Gammaproteobacteria bacterium]|nr:hypothetical protein [Gammaproteobacteria bacterium]